MMKQHKTGFAVKLVQKSRTRQRTDSNPKSKSPSCNQGNRSMRGFMNGLCIKRVWLLVREGGFEPPYLGCWILSPVRLPVPPLSQRYFYTSFAGEPQAALSASSRQPHPKSLYSPIDRGTNKKWRSHLCSAEQRAGGWLVPGESRKIRFLRAGKENGAFCAETDRKAAQRAVPVGEQSEPYGHREQSCTHVHEQQKAPAGAASTQQAVLTDHHGK